MSFSIALTTADLEAFLNGVNFELIRDLKFKAARGERASTGALTLTIHSAQVGSCVNHLHIPSLRLGPSLPFFYFLIALLCRESVFNASPIFYMLKLQ